MKILLIDVPFEIEKIGGKGGNFAGVLNAIPALGLAYLASIAEREGHEVRILDCANVFGRDAIEKEGRSFKPNVVGMTATTPTFGNVLHAAEMLRKVVPDAAFVVGGPHPTALPDDAAASRTFDFLVIREGENTFSELLAHLEGKGTREVENIPGLAFWRNGHLFFTEPRPLIQDLDSIPFPARHLLPPLKAYSPTPASCRKLPLAHIMTSRGCPSKCNFCDRSIFGETYRARSADNVLEEVEEVVGRFGAKEIRFFDDTFTLKKKRLEKICNGMKRVFPRIPWTCLTKVNAVNPNILKMLHDSGCWQVLYGLESGDDRVLKTLGKNNTVEQNRRAVLWAREAGLRVRADFLVGTSVETIETLQNTLSFAKELPLDFAHFNKFVPFPGTTFYRQLVQEGYEFDFSQSSTLNHDALVYTPPGINKKVYRQFLDHAYKEFYMRPKYIFRRLLAMRTLTEFWVNFKGMFSIGSL